MAPRDPAIALPWVLLGCWIFVVLIILATLAWGAHGDWQDKYRAATGDRCCGPNDCVVVRARVVTWTQKEVIADVNGETVTLAAGSVHVSEDVYDYACLISKTPHVPLKENIRCLFVGVGS